MNLANRLTVSRIGLTFVMTFFLTFPSIPFGKTMALIVFIAASLTDYWDGRIARQANHVTSFGKFMDPLADKILVCAAFVSFAAIQQVVPAWVVITIISRDFVVTGLRLVAAGAGTVIPAGAIGKHKTGWQIGVIIVINAGLAIETDLLPRLLPHLPPAPWVAAFPKLFADYFRYVTYALSSLAAILTVVSGVVYMWKNRHLYINDM